MVLLRVGGCCAYTSGSWKAEIKEMLGQVVAANSGMYSPLDSTPLIRSALEILVGLIKRVSNTGMQEPRLNVGFSPKRS